jgi:hypothetical protein
MDKLLPAGFIKEVMYPAWLKKLIMVKKSNNKWQICVDFIDLNKICLKDSYHFANINQLVDSTAGFEYLTFLDSNFRYHQIPMHPDDKEKTTFITEGRTFCYKVILFWA